MKQVEKRECKINHVKENWNVYNNHKKKVIVYIFSITIG